MACAFQTGEGSPQPSPIQVSHLAQPEVSRFVVFALGVLVRRQPTVGNYAAVGLPDSDGALPARGVRHGSHGEKYRVRGDLGVTAGSRFGE